MKHLKEQHIPTTAGYRFEVTNTKRPAMLPGAAVQSTLWLGSCSLLIAENLTVFDMNYALAWLAVSIS